MKNLLQSFLIILTMLVAVACQENKKPSENPPKDDVVVDDVSECGTIADYEVYNLTAQIWQNTWEELLTRQGIYDSINIGNLNEYGQFALGRYFDTTQIQTLFDQCPSCPDVRIYFAHVKTPLPGLDIAPDLIMVNANGCHDSLTDQILLSDTSGTSFIGVDSARSYINRWAADWPSFTYLKRVDGYTYKRSDVQEEMTAGLDDNLAFNFAMHAQDGLELANGGKGYAEYQGYMVVDLLIGDSVDNKGTNQSLYVDFAQPCPTICGQNSPIYSGGTEEVDWAERSVMRKAAEVTETSCGKITDYKVFTETASLWLDAWEKMLRSVEGSEPGSLLPYLAVFLDTDKLTTALSQCPTCTDVRIYFARHDSSTVGLNYVPDLILVNANGCQDSLNDTLLICGPGSGVNSYQEFITLEEATQYVNNWKNYWPNPTGLKQLYSYTFTRSTLTTALENARDNLVTIYFVAHAARDLQTTSGEANAIQGDMVVDLVFLDRGPEGSKVENFVDFAQPCPTICGNSVLNVSGNE